MFNCDDSIIRPYILIGTWSDHPGQQCNHKAIWLWLGQLIRNLSVRYALPEKGWEVSVVGV